MTAYVNVIVSQRKSALLVPNAALRFKPEGSQAVAKGKPAEEKAQGTGGSVFVIEKERLRATPLRLGISDGKFTEVLAGDVKDGDPLVVGAAEAPAGSSQSTLRMRPL
jgi:HlyD family secretion protein